MITFIPVYCNTDRYNPVFINIGIAIIGIAIINHQLLLMCLPIKSSDCKKKESHKENIKIIKSKDKVIICLYNLSKLSNLVFKSLFYFCYNSI